MARHKFGKSSLCGRRRAADTTPEVSRAPPRHWAHSLQDTRRGERCSSVGDGLALWERGAGREREWRRRDNEPADARDLAGRASLAVVAERCESVRRTAKMEPAAGLSPATRRDGSVVYSDHSC